MPVLILHPQIITHLKFQGRTNEYFEVLEKEDYSTTQSVEGALSMIWFCEDQNILTIDSEKRVFDKNEIIFLNPFNKVEVKEIKKHRYLRFNAPFYCILNHDEEVGCKGVLFYGPKSFPTLLLKGEDLEILETVWKMLVLEMQSKDNLQLEMLQMMLKRILILCTRMFKSQEDLDELDKVQHDVVREFNYLVDQHFRNHHTVAEYAKLLNKAPKTLSNLFKKIGSKSPLQHIQDRIMLEVRRLLRYTDMPVSEIGYEVGFNDVQGFSRFFKKHEGISPSQFRSS